jgi:hypothetical protein
MTTLRSSHRENEKCGFKKKFKLVSKFSKKHKTSSNEELISEVHIFF